MAHFRWYWHQITSSYAHWWTVVDIVTIKQGHHLLLLKCRSPCKEHNINKSAAPAIPVLNLWAARNPYKKTRFAIDECSVCSYWNLAWTADCTAVERIVPIVLPSWFAVLNIPAPNDWSLWGSVWITMRMSTGPNISTLMHKHMAGNAHAQ